LKHFRSRKIFAEGVKIKTPNEERKSEITEGKKKKRRMRTALGEMGEIKR